MTRKLGPEYARGLGECVADRIDVVDPLRARAEAPGNPLQVHIWIVEVHAHEARALDRRAHRAAPEVLEQAIFMVHEADKYRRNTVLSSGPNRVDGEQAPAVPDAADGVFVGREADPHAERHRPPEPSATRRETDVLEP